MAKCAQCGALILFGPVKHGGHKFCSNECRDGGLEATATAELPAEFVYEKACEIHDGSCPRCGGEGPVEAHFSHKVWSFVVITSFNSKPEICCERCARGLRLRAILSCGTLGWWGFPFGVFGTPVQLLRNLGPLRSTPVGAKPSIELVQLVRENMASTLMNSTPAAESESN